MHCSYFCKLLIIISCVMIRRQGTLQSIAAPIKFNFPVLSLTMTLHELAMISELFARFKLIATGLVSCLNVHQIMHYSTPENQKKFLGRGHSPSKDPSLLRRGTSPSLSPTPSAPAVPRYSHFRRSTCPPSILKSCIRPSRGRLNASFRECPMS